MSQPKDEPPTNNEKDELFPLTCNMPELKLALATFNYGQEKHFEGMRFMKSHASLFHTIHSVIKSYKSSAEYDQIQQKPTQIYKGVPLDDNNKEEDSGSIKNIQRRPVLTEDGQEETQVGPILVEDGQVGLDLAKDDQVVPVWAEDEKVVPVLDEDEYVGQPEDGHVGVLIKDEQVDHILAEDSQLGLVLAEDEHVGILTKDELVGHSLAEDDQLGSVLAEDEHAGILTKDEPVGRSLAEDGQLGLVLAEDEHVDVLTKDEPVDHSLAEDGQLGPVLAEDGHVDVLTKDEPVDHILAKDGQVGPLLVEDEDKQKHPVLAKEGQEAPVFVEEGQESPILAKEHPVLAENTQKDKGLCKSIHSKQLLASKYNSSVAGRQQILSHEELTPARMIPYVILITRSISLPRSIIQSLCLEQKILCRLHCFTLRCKKKKLMPQPALAKQPIPKVQTDQDFVTFDNLKSLQWKLYKGIAKRKPKTKAAWTKSNYSLGKIVTPYPREAVYILPLIPKKWIIDASIE